MRSLEWKKDRAVSLPNARWDGGDIVRAALLSLVMIAVVVLALMLWVRSQPEGRDLLTSTKLIGIPVALILLAAQEGILAVSAWRFSLVKYRSGLRALGFTAPRGWAPYFKAVGGWIIAVTIVALWQQLIDALGWDTLELSQEAAELLEFGGGLGFSILVVGIWGPVMEEIFFRGFALSGLVSRFGTLGALVLSSALFALFHLDPRLYVPIFIFGMVLGWLYVSTGSIWPPILAHALQNTAALLSAASL